MIKPTLRALGLSTVSALIISTSAISADGDSPIGIWIDHSGQGAVEIRDCDGKLCGQVVWLKSARDASRCKLPVIGGLAAAADGNWSGGWIYDPQSKSKFDVEITPVSGGNLKVVGYAGTKALSRTMTWTKAPDGLKRCDDATPAIVTAQAEANKAVPVPPGGGEAGISRPASRVQRVAASARSDKRRGAAVKLAQLGPYGLQDVTLRKSRGACSLKVSDFARVAFPC